MMMLGNPPKRFACWNEAKLRPFSGRESRAAFVSGNSEILLDHFSMASISCNPFKAPSTLRRLHTDTSAEEMVPPARKSDFFRRSLSCAISKVNTAFAFGSTREPEKFCASAGANFVVDHSSH